MITKEEFKSALAPCSHTDKVIWELIIKLLNERDAYRFLAVQLWEGQALPEPNDWMEISPANQQFIDCEAERLLAQRSEGEEK